MKLQFVLNPDSGAHGDEATEFIGEGPTLLAALSDVDRQLTAVFGEPASLMNDPLFVEEALGVLKDGRKFESPDPWAATDTENDSYFIQVV